MPDRFNNTEDIEWLDWQFEQGRNARLFNEPITDDPYPPNSLRSKSFRAGWADRDMALTSDTGGDHER